TPRPALSSTTVFASCSSAISTVSNCFADAIFPTSLGFLNGMWCARVGVPARLERTAQGRERVGRIPDRVVDPSEPGRYHSQQCIFVRFAACWLWLRGAFLPSCFPARRRVLRLSRRAGS